MLKGSWTKRVMRLLMAFDALQRNTDTDDIYNMYHNHSFLQYTSVQIWMILYGWNKGFLLGWKQWPIIIITRCLDPRWRNQPCSVFLLFMEVVHVSPHICQSWLKHQHISTFLNLGLLCFWCSENFNVQIYIRIYICNVYICNVYICNVYIYMQCMYICNVCMCIFILYIYRYNLYSNLI